MKVKPTRVDTRTITLEKVGPRNLQECGFGCLVNPKNLGFQPKVDWLNQRFAEGLRLLMFRDAKGNPLAFLEYVPGEYAWRPVNAEGWLFVHCLWVYRRGQEVGGLGGRLIRACLAEARKVRAAGVAAMVSDGVWMAGKEVFQKNGFRQIAQADRFQLVIRRLGRGPEPRFRDIPHLYGCTTACRAADGRHVVRNLPLCHQVRDGEPRWDDL